MKFPIALFRFLFHIGYFGPLVMGVLDSSFLILPFGNDLLIVGLVARHHHGMAWVGYVLSAACGSTLGALLLAAVCRKLGEERLKKMAGARRHNKLRAWIGKHATLAIAVAGLAPPPFPFTTVIAAAGALEYPLWRIGVVNFLARVVRFTLLALLALRYGRLVVGIGRSGEFEWSVLAFVFLCLVGSGFSIWRWLRKPGPKSATKSEKAEGENRKAEGQNKKAEPQGVRPHGTVKSLEQR
jgi:membrane protein YqaA with SNARE-associated domain